jgi:hypothetical protein
VSDLGPKAGISPAENRVAFRKKIYGSIADLQADLDRWIQNYKDLIRDDGASAKRQCKLP